MKTIAVIFGGRSAEHDVSIITALTSIIKPLKLTQKYRVVPVYIAKDGRWLTGEDLMDIRTYQGAGLAAFMAKSKPVAGSVEGSMVLALPTRTGRKRITVDIVFPAMHGTYGEDGALAGLLDMAGVPYVGCGVAASAIAMDKVLAKQLALANNIAVTNFLSFTKGKVIDGLPTVIRQTTKVLKYPLFVKPAHLGSSIGITRVTDDTELSNALEVAIYYDDVVIVEEAVQNLIEVTLPIIGTSAAPRPALLEQPITKTKDFFDFDTKYLNGAKKAGSGQSGKRGGQGYSQIPANLSKQLYKQAEEIGTAIYTAFGCDGIARVDMLIDSKASVVYFNELNPLPGSLYAHNWAQAGLSKVALVEQLIEFAEQRYAARERLATTFATSFLQQF